ncbi:MAG: helix-turn-helix domain-containing protein [Patescibacteria group bacterium]|nr:helix-turn-helix domain-containing protein [Patescibacteria group bacterium]
MDINTRLLNLGLKKNQVKIYLTLLQLGSANIQEVADKAQIKRTTTYSILDSLIKRGFISFSQKGTHREYFAENPKKITAYFKQQEEKIRNEEDAFSELMPELLSFYNIRGIKPKIRTYEGLDGIKAIFDESIESKYNEDMLVYSAYESTTKYLEQYIKEYIVRRVKKGLKQRCLAELSSQSMELQKNDGEELRITRLISKEKFPLFNQIIIYGNKVFIASYKDLLSIIIESSAIARTQKTIFELAWIGSESENKQEAPPLNIPQ